MRPKYGILFLFFLGVIGGAIYSLGRLYVDNRTLQEKIHAAEQEVKQQQQQISSLRALLEALQNDPKAVERVARKHLRMSKEDEMIYTFSDPNPQWRTTEAARSGGSTATTREVP